MPPGVPVEAGGNGARRSYTAGDEFGDDHDMRGGWGCSVI